MNEVDVLASGPVEDGAGVPQGPLVHIDAHDRPLCSNQVGQLEETAEGPAANVHYLVAESQIRPTKAVPDVLGQYLCATDQTSDRFVRIPDVVGFAARVLIRNSGEACWIWVYK